MKQISVAGTLVVSDDIYKLLCEQNMIAGEDLAGSSRTTNAFMFLLHDALDIWYKTDKLKTQEVSESLVSQLKQLNQGVTALQKIFTSGAIQHIQFSQDEEHKHVEEESAVVVEEPVVEKAPQPQAPRPFNPADIANRLGGFMNSQKGGQA